MYRRGIVTPFTAEAEKLSSGEFLNAVKNNIKDRTRISFTCDIKEMGDDAVIRVGHGFEISCGSWVEITKKEISVCQFYSWHNPQKSYALAPTALEVEISDFLTVAINRDSAGNGTFIIVMSKGGMQKIDLGRMGGDIGEVFASPLNCEIENCKLNFIADGYADPIWVFGDSYLSFPDPARWPTYLYRDKFSKVLLAGYSGMSTERGLEDFKVAIEKGTPVYAVWCLGMNNGDKTEEPNPGWLASTEEFLAICKEKGITPILSTIPTTPVVNNSYKNEWVRNSGYRYIDFNRAVGADKAPEWYPEMLFKDNVHPARRGAEALYSQVLIDFPEIMKR
jgi:hypothetical protein